MSKPAVTIVITTYNKPKFLKLVLLSYTTQTFNDFEIIIADDGSGIETEDVIDYFSENSALRIMHVWQEDNGFQKTKILNQAIIKSASNYLIFTDDDCIARKDFVETHLKLRQLNCALSGGYFKLTDDVSNKITETVILNQECFDSKWLLENGQPKSFKLNKLTKSRFKANLLNTVTPTKATFDGMNVSAWKSDIMEVNGFDERMQYGGLDREIGERLMNLGVKFKQIRYSAICVHLYHDRPYKNEETISTNKAIRLNTKKNKIIYTNFGIKTVL